MDLTFLGASGEVTGSCYLLRTDRSRVLIDCGMFQGSATADLKNRRPLAIDPATIDAAILTHAHIDHSGRLPLLTKSGFRGKVFCTPPTVALTDLLLKDAAHLQSEEADRMNRRRQRRGGPRATPLFDEQDVPPLIKRLTPVPYARDVEVAPGVRVTFHDAGHILGSASVSITVSERGRTCTVAFSGDLGERNTVILNDPQKLTHADVIVMESTYGDRDHRDLDQTVAQFKQLIVNSAHSRGKVLIPAFAIGRTQTLIYYLAQMHREGLLGNAPVYIDSPMAIAATRLYQSHADSFDSPARELLRSGRNPLTLPQLRLSTSAEESRAINAVSGSAIVIAGSGMCTGGRILHHLRHNLWKPETTVIIAGFQAEGSLGRRLVNREKIVKIYGEPIMVRAKIETLGGFSAHAGQSTLLDWFAPLAPKTPRIFLTHGEQAPRQALAAALHSRYNVKAELPMLGESFEL
jgi:metallo-beta-lactamase family protein